MISVRSGSSPLTRGKPAIGHTQSYDKRLIPAHAGKTTRPADRLSLQAAHPRSRGENDAVVRRLAVLPGSSPLTRGKRCGGASTGRPPRLIPAHAGKTRLLRTSLTATWAHPRSRGENLRLAETGMDVLGSSPLTRGKRTVPTCVSSTPRLIPAHAGKTGYSAGYAGSSSAHPRSRGENSEAFRQRARQSGSSPLTRGKP